MARAGTQQHTPPREEPCACTPEASCGLHYATLSLQERRQVRDRAQIGEGVLDRLDRAQRRPRPAREDRRYFCKTCGANAPGVAPPEGWLRIQRRSEHSEQQTGHLFETYGLFCSPACLVLGGFRLAYGHVTSPEQQAELRHLAGQVRVVAGIQEWTPPWVTPRPAGAGGEGR